MSDNPFEGTIFESVDAKDVGRLIDSMPSFSAEEEISELTDFTMQDILADERKEIAEAKSKEVVISTGDQMLDDFQKARDNIRGLTERQQEILDTLIDLARNSESPRAYEVVANMLNVFADLEGKLLDLHKKRMDIEAKRNQQGAGAPQVADQISNTQNNIMFTGTTKEFAEMIAHAMQANQVQGDD